MAECLGIPCIPDDDNWYCPCCRADSSSCQAHSSTERNDSGRYGQMGIKVQRVGTKGSSSRLCEREVKTVVDINGGCIVCD